MQIPRWPIRHSNPLRVVVPVMVVVALALPATAAAGVFTAQLHAPNHEPKVGNWKITVTASRDGQPLSGHIDYRFLFQGQVVKTWAGGSFRHGVYHDTLNWPARAIGHTITLQVVVTTRYGTDDLNWWIRVRA